MSKKYKGTRSSLGPGASNRAGRIMGNLKEVYPVSDQDINRLKASIDNSQKTTKVTPDGMGKDATAAIKEFLKNNKE